MSFNVKDMMKQAQAMQEKMQQLQEQLAEAEVFGQAGGGLVKVVMTAGAVLRNISINPSLIKADEKETLEDLIVAAVNDAKNKADEKIADETGKMMGGFEMPPGFQLPGSK